MRRLWIGLAFCWSAPLGGCTPSSPDRGQPAESIEKSDPPNQDPPNQDPPNQETCEQQIARYLSARAELSHCETDSDCSEMWPGLCPHGPYYIHREADIAPIFELEGAIMAGCEVPECEPPMELGIAHCAKNHCMKARPEPTSTGMESCWDYRESWLEANGAADGRTAKTLQGITPHVAIAPAATGVLVIEVDWPVGCADCRLMISEHNSGMSRLIDAKPTSTQTERNGQPIVRERWEFPVTPGPYHMVALSGSDASYLIHADLRDDSGERGNVTRHGVGWQRMCEG